MHSARQRQTDMGRQETAVRLNGHTGVEFLQKASFLGGLSPSFCHVINMHSFSCRRSDSEYMRKLIVCGTPAASANTQAEITYSKPEV